jgi:hypothetical protein
VKEIKIHQCGAGSHGTFRTCVLSGNGASDFARNKVLKWSGTAIHNRKTEKLAE